MYIRDGWNVPNVNMLGVENIFKFSSDVLQNFRLLTVLDIRYCRPVSWDTIGTLKLHSLKITVQLMSEILLPFIYSLPPYLWYRIVLQSLKTRILQV